MRQNSPFAGLLSDIERKSLLDAWKASEAVERQ
jgi:hypothetical protein